MVTVFLYRIPGFHVCPPVQEDNDSPEMTTLSSTVECGGPNLPERYERVSSFIVL